MSARDPLAEVLAARKWCAHEEDTWREHDIPSHCHDCDAAAVRAYLTSDETEMAAAKAIRGVRRRYWQPAHASECIRDARAALAAATEARP